MPHATQIQRIKSNKKYISFHVSIWKTYIFLYTYIFAVFSSLKPTWECLKKLQIKKSKEVYRSKNGEFCNLVDLKLQKWRWFLNVVMVFQKKPFDYFLVLSFYFLSCLLLLHLVSCSKAYNNFTVHEKQQV